MIIFTSLALNLDLWPNHPLQTCHPEPLGSPAENTKNYEITQNVSQMGGFNLQEWQMTQQSNPGLFAFQETLQVHKKYEEKKWEWSKHDAES